MALCFLLLYYLNFKCCCHFFRYSEGVSSPERHVKTRLYFTSESHIHSLLTILRYGGLCNVSTAHHYLCYLFVCLFVYYLFVYLLTKLFLNQKLIYVVGRRIQYKNEENGQINYNKEIFVGEERYFFKEIVFQKLWIEEGASLSAVLESPSRSGDQLGRAIFGSLAKNFEKRMSYLQKSIRKRLRWSNSLGNLLGNDRSKDCRLLESF